jgi:hypothetical protein
MEKDMNAAELSSTSNKGDPYLRQAVGEIVHKISQSLPDLDKPIKMYLAGGMAVNFYTGYRPTEDVDASFSARLLLPKDLVVSFPDANGKPKMVYFDTNYNTSFALVHPDFEQDAYLVMGSEFDDPRIELRILSPVDLALSKVARFEGNDKEDIAELARHHLVSSRGLNERAQEALGYYVGSQSMLLINLKEAVNIIQSIRNAKPRG